MLVCARTRERAYERASVCVCVFECVIFLVCVLYVCVVVCLCLCARSRAECACIDVFAFVHICLLRAGMWSDFSSWTKEHERSVQQAHGLSLSATSDEEVRCQALVEHVRSNQGVA